MFNLINKEIAVKDHKMIMDFIDSIAVKGHKMIMDFIDSHDIGIRLKINRIYIERNQTPTLFVYRNNLGEHYSMELIHSRYFTRGSYSIKSWLTAPHLETDPFELACGKQFDIYWEKGYEKT